MSVSLAYLERCSAETGFGVAGLEKVVRLGAMAGEVGRHPLLSKALALKGGTALHLAHGPPERLSVDLDFNYVGALERERMLEERPRVEGALDGLAQRAGYRVQRSAEAFAGRKLFLHYRSVLGPEERIEVDVNYLMRQPLGEPGVAELWQPGELDRPRLSIVGDEELVIGKLCALLDRCAVRDVWDVANLRARAAAALGLPRFRGRFLALASTLDHPPDTYTEQRLAERTTQRVVDEQLVPMLAAGAEVHASELVGAAWSRLAPLIALRKRSEHSFRGSTEVSWTPPSCSRTIRRSPRGSPLTPRCDGRPRMRVRTATAHDGFPVSGPPTRRPRPPDGRSSSTRRARRHAPRWHPP